MGRRRSLFLPLAVGLLLIAGCRKNAKKGTSADAVPVEQPQLVMMPLRIQAYGTPGLEWELRSPQARAYTTMNVMRAEQVDLTLYDTGKKSTTINSERGVFCIEDSRVAMPPTDVFATKIIEEGGIALRSGDMFLSGSVVVVSTDGTKLYTDWLHYEKKDEVIRSTAPVKIVRSDSVTTGTGLEATPDLQSVKIFKQTLVIKGDDETK